ncbi:RNA transcription [Babesia gibsoni]|uniref:RNA transcription n=1 Tax=Babesia gibsoni TaxID=33632 RepID=A0AAD8PCS8_BABGI|nr:RNA transcription [Babesia gibsoni]
MAREDIVLRKFRALEIKPPKDIYSHFQVLVLKLEEEKIRRYPVAKRDVLKVKEPAQWLDSFRKYCDDVGLDVNGDIPNGGTLTNKSRLNILDKLLTVALQEEYLDLVEDGKLNIATEDKAQEPNTAAYDAVVRKVNELLGKLGIPVLTEDPAVEDIRSAIVLLLSIKPEEETKDSQAPEGTGDVYMDLDSVPCGIRTRDPMILKAARILRTLHSNELCNLQSETVWLSERFQQLTANPRTNTNAQ